MSVLKKLSQRKNGGFSLLPFGRRWRETTDEGAFVASSFLLITKEPSSALRAPSPALRGKEKTAALMLVLEMASTEEKSPVFLSLCTNQCVL